MIGAPHSNMLSWVWARTHHFIHNPPYFVRESSRAHLRLFLVQVLFVLTIVFCIQFDPRPGDIGDKLFFVWNGRGYLLVATLSLFAALMTGTEFFRSLYCIASFRVALNHYLAASMFGIGFVNGLNGIFRAFVSLTFWHLFAPLLGFWGYKYFVVEKGEIRSEDQDSPVIKAGGPCFLVIIRDTALVLEQNGCSTRVVGPGFAFLEPFETIRDVVDLRPQVRAKDVEALTKDGIPIQVNLEIEFMIQPKRHQGGQSDADPYPFREGAVRRAVYKKAVFQHEQGEKILDWKALVMWRAEFELQRLLNTYVLDRLIEPEDANPRVPLDLQEPPRREIQDRLRQNLNASGDLRQLDAVNLGATASRVTLEHFQIRADLAAVIKQIKDNRIKSWKAEWDKRIKFRQAEGEAADTRWREAARAQAQAEMLRAITRGVEELDAANRANLPHLLALRTIEALEQMPLDPWAQTFVPEQTLTMLRRLRALYV